MIELLRDQNSLPIYSEGSVTRDAKTVNVLFDESHGELLRSPIALEDIQSGEIDTYETLSSELKEWHWEICSHRQNEIKICDEILEGKDIVVLAAPTIPLNSEEIEVLINFVDRGNSLLILNNSYSLWEQTDYHVNALLKPFGLSISRLLSYPPTEVSSFHVHYLCSGVSNLSIQNPVYLKLLDSLGTHSRPSVVASLPWTNKPFLAAIERKRGRLVVMGDFTLLGDREIARSDNQVMTRNIFQWLARENQLDFCNPEIQSEIQDNKPTQFSITISNLHSERIHHIRCLLESNADVAIEEPIRRIRSLKQSDHVHLQWKIQPRKLGLQKLKLTIDFPKDPTKCPIFFDSAAQFQYLSNTAIDFQIVNIEGSKMLETGVPFELRAVVKHSTGDSLEQMSKISLDTPLPHISAESLPALAEARWKLQANESGDWPITLSISETEQRVSQFIHIHPSLDEQIMTIERDVSSLLMTEIHHHMVQVRSEFNAENLHQIPFHVVTPEKYIQKIYPSDVAELLSEALQAAWIEQHEYKPLIDQVLQNIAPVYSPVHGCYIPYAPKLAAHLLKNHALYEENLANNFLSIEGLDRYDAVWIKQSLAALILHEKYGHGFFFTQTTLGKQLSVLYQHGLLRRMDSDRLTSPYPRSLYEKYKDVIQSINHSALLVNEGFATWVELSGLTKMSGIVGQIAYRRRDFLFNRDKSLEQLASSGQSRYFNMFPPFCASRYQEGCEYFELIQGYFGKKCGPKCAVQAMIKATDINLGISEYNKQVHFALGTDVLEAALLNPEEGDDARADMRLRRIHSVLRKNREWIHTKQQQLQCHRECLHGECPVNAVILEKLGW
jgi:hypothetical protein